MKETEIRVVLVTAPSKEVARSLAEKIVGERLAACVNLLPGIESIYRWQGQVEHASETLLIVKTPASRLADLERAIREAHPYEVPELIALNPEHVLEPYRKWVLEEGR